MPKQSADRRPQGGLKVLVVESALRENGGLRVSLEYARQWNATGAPTTVAVLQDIADEPLARPDPALQVRFMTPRQSRFRYMWPLALARLASRARRADVVVSGSEIGIGLLVGYAAARLARRPFAVLVQAELDEAIKSWVPGPLHRVTRWVHAHSDAAVCVTDSLVSGVVANGLPPSRAHVVINGIDVARVRELAGLDELSTAGAEERGATAAPGGSAGPGRHDLPTIVGNGRLHGQKDFALLVRAHAQVRADGFEHRLVLLGEGPARPELEALVAELGVDDSVELPGFAENPYRQIAAADLFVLSSRMEGMPLTLLEALAVGVPIIATRCGTGPDTLLDGGKYGDLVPVGSSNAMAAALKRHLRDPQPLRTRALGGPQQARTFDVGSSARMILRILTLLANPQPQRSGRTPAKPQTRIRE